MEKRRPLVLVADDDADIRAIISGSIAMMEIDVKEAADGDEAVRIIENSTIDLAVLDYMMPGRDGLEVSKHLKSREEGLYVPVIILTARDALTDKVKAFDQGIDDYLTKPFNYEELQARVRSQLRLREANLELKQKNSELISAQQKIVEQEKKLLLNQIAGTTSHNLGQPLSAIILNCHLLDRLEPSDPRFLQALTAIKADTKRMAEIIQKLQMIDPNKTEKYHAGMSVLQVDRKES